MLVKALHEAGYPLAVLAPSGNHSATGMRINLMKPMAFRARDDLTEAWGLNPHETPVHLFELDGTPCDTMIVALAGGLNHLVPGVHPQLVVSGVNLGPNLNRMPTTAAPWSGEKQACTVYRPLRVVHVLRPRGVERC